MKMKRFQLFIYLFSNESKENCYMTNHLQTLNNQTMCVHFQIAINANVRYHGHFGKIKIKKKKQREFKINIEHTQKIKKNKKTQKNRVCEMPESNIICIYHA